MPWLSLGGDKGQSCCPKSMGHFYPTQWDGLGHEQAGGICPPQVNWGQPTSASGTSGLLRPYGSTSIQTRTGSGRPRPHLHTVPNSATMLTQSAGPNSCLSKGEVGLCVHQLPACSLPAFSVPPTPDSKCSHDIKVKAILR